MELKPINLQLGWPTPRLHPSEAIQAAATSILYGPDLETQLQYGPELGNASLREALGSWLNTSYTPKAGNVPLDRIVITNGASNGLSTILQKFTDPRLTRGVWMIEPTYFLASPIFRDAGLTGKIFGVPEGDAGVDLTYLQGRLESMKGDESTLATLSSKGENTGHPKIYQHIIYLTPTFSNPSGKIMGLETRRGLVELARRYDALLISDDVYDVLSWPVDDSQPLKTVGVCPPRLVDIDREMSGASPWGNTVSNGSFSKIVAPGARVGWLEATPQFVSGMATLGTVCSGGCQSQLASLIIEGLLVSGGLDKHIQETLIPTYRGRWQAMMGAINKRLCPIGVTIVDSGSSTIAGGYFVYITFPSKYNATETAKRALDKFNLKIAPGPIFSVPDDPASHGRGASSYLNGARLCWAWHEEEEIVEGIERLATVLEEQSRVHGKAHNSQGNN